MSSFLEFSSRQKKSTTLNTTTNRNLKHAPVAKKSSLQNSKKQLGEMAKELKNRQEKLMGLEEKNLSLFHLNQTLIEDLKKTKSGGGLIKKYEEQIAYLKESQQELFIESCEQKQQIKLLQQKIEKYLEGNVEEKNILREYYNSYFQEQIFKEKSKNEMIIKELKQENDNLKQILHESAIRRKDSLNSLQESNVKTSRKSSHLLANLLNVGTPIGKNNQESTEKKWKKNSLIKDRKGSFQINRNSNFFEENIEQIPEDPIPVNFYRRMSHQVNYLENGLQKLGNSINSSRKDFYPSTTRFINERNEEKYENNGKFDNYDKYRRIEKTGNYEKYGKGDRNEILRETQGELFQTLNSMKKELRKFEQFS